MCINDCFVPILICSIGVVLLGSLIATIIANIIEYYITKKQKVKEENNDKE